MRNVATATRHLARLAGDDSRISFEGTLANIDLPNVSGVRQEETETLRRGTIRPQFEFLALPLTPESMPEIEKAIQSRIAFNHNEGNVHVQIEKNGQLAFVASDQFDEGCVTAIRPAVRLSLLEELVQKKILHFFEAGQTGVISPSH
jgi:hypothetical protein